MSNPAVESDAVIAADRRFFDALLAADHAALDQALAPQFLIVDVAAGGVTARADFLEAVKNHLVRFERIESFPHETIVRHFGTTAIAVGRTQMAFSLPDGRQVSAASRYTHVFVSSGHGLQLVSAQGTAIPAQ